MMVGKAFNKLKYRIILYIVCGMIVGVSKGQTTLQPHASPAKVSEAIARVRSGELFLHDVEIIGQAHAVEAIPDLEKKFTTVPEPLDKAKIAQVLLLLGDKKDLYWNYLEALVKPALESDAPDPTPYDAQGKHVPGLSQKFIQWAQAHGQPPGQEGETAVYLWPGYVMLLGATGDSRALPLLRQALYSQNPLIQSAAAEGLAEMQDVSSVPLIISKCKEAKPGFAKAIAESLVYFDDPDAQKAVDTYIPRDQATALREARAEGRGALHDNRGDR